MNCRFHIIASFLRLSFPVIFGFFFLLVANVSASDLSSAPLVFSFSMNPVSPPTPVVTHSESQEFDQRLFSNKGVMLNTVVESVGLKGGISYFSGKGSKASTLESFSSLYSFDGWSNFDNILVFPNQISAFSSGNIFGKETIDNQLQALSLYGGYDLTPSIKIKGAFLISKTPKANEIPEHTNLVDSSYSWWLDFGGDYKLNEKMTYSVNFGYYDSDEVTNSIGNEMVQGSVYLFNNQLNMSF